MWMDFRGWHLSGVSGAMDQGLSMQSIQMAGGEAGTSAVGGRYSQAMGAMGGHKTNNCWALEDVAEGRQDARKNVGMGWEHLHKETLICSKHSPQAQLRAIFFELHPCSYCLLAAENSSCKDLVFSLW